MVYTLGALHDMNTGIILTCLTIAYLKSRSRNIEPAFGLATLAVFIITLLPTPFHGTGIFGIFSLVVTYAYLYKTWGEFKTKNREIPYLVLSALLFIMMNIIIGQRLIGTI